MMSTAGCAGRNRPDPAGRGQVGLASAALFWYDRGSTGSAHEAGGQGLCRVVRRPGGCGRGWAFQAPGLMSRNH